MKLELIVSVASGKWSIRAGGAILGETTKALELHEGDSKPALYFPKKDLAMVFLKDRTRNNSSPERKNEVLFNSHEKSDLRKYCMGIYRP